LIISPIPLLGSAECGLFGITEDYEEAFLSLDQHFVAKREATFFFRAKGDSMRPLILPGDILIVDRSLTARSGQVVVATLNGERLCKRLRTTGGRACLCSENEKYKLRWVDSEQDDFVIFGVVAALARHLQAL
jgi:DNA polymerase V